MKKRLSELCYRAIKKIVDLCYPEIEIVGIENLPEDPVVYVGNHAQIHGPLTAELRIPKNPYTWCAGQMMHLKEVPAYTYQDFWDGKPRSVRWVYKIISYLIAPLSTFLFNHARTIAVYHDARVISTLKNATNLLVAGNSEVVFPEYREPYNPVVNRFQERFIDVARFYYKKTGKELSFVPMYLAPKLKKLYFGIPTQFRSNCPIEEERTRVCKYLMNEITRIALSLPEHTMIPYQNISKKDYKTNLEVEVNVYEKKTGC